MKPRLACAAFLVVAAITPSLFAEPAQDLDAALRAFLAEFSYTWGPVRQTRGLPEAPMGSDVQAVRGQHERGGFTKMYLTGGPQYAPDASRSKLLASFTDKEPWLNSRWVFETEDGWKTLEELPAPNRPGPRMPPRSGIGVMMGSSVSFRAFGARRPDHEIAAILDHLEAVELENGIYRAAIAPEGAAELLARGRLPMPTVMPASRVEKASGTIRVWLKEGVLVRYEILADGLGVMAGFNSSHLTYKVEREITDVGSTVVDAPPEVKERFAR